MNLLIVDSSSSFLQVALKTKLRGNFTYTLEQKTTFSNAYLAEAINFLKTQSTISFADLDLLISAEGPGSFTGLRVGMALIKGLACALDLPFVFINTLDALAFPYRLSDHAVLSVIDARKAKVYSALYRSGERISPYWDLRPEQLLQELQDYKNLKEFFVVGNAVQIFKERAQDLYTLHEAHFALDTLRGLEGLGVQKYLHQGSDAHGRGLFYIRDSDAVPVTKKQNSPLF